MQLRPGSSNSPGSSHNGNHSRQSRPFGLPHTMSPTALARWNTSSALAQTVSPCAQTMLVPGLQLREVRLLVCTHTFELFGR